MMIECSDDDFHRLLLLASIGERVRNDWIGQQQWTDAQQRDADVLMDLCARAANGRFADLVMQDPDTGEWVPSPALEAETDRALGDYDEEVFWDQLVLRMARRDLVAEYGREALERLAPGHRQLAEEAMVHYYEREIDRNGIARLQVPEEQRAPVRSVQRHNPPAPSTENALRDLE